ncbi:translation initiation factor 2 [Agrobacterium sp. ICMP 6402]|nr:translation initiation factor 2 [Agrobacterium sp. ICMP 6402]
MFKFIFTISAAALLSSCGSITRGTEEAVTIISEPPDAVITTSLGPSCPKSPCTLVVKRNQSLIAHAEKPGYEKGSVAINTKMSGKGTLGLAGNVIAGGLIGVAIDGATGAGLDHYPNPATIVLKPISISKAKQKPVTKPKPVKTAPAKPSVPTS